MEDLCVTGCGIVESRKFRELGDFWLQPIRLLAVDGSVDGILETHHTGVT